MTYKLVSLDIDGTVRTPTHPVTGHTRRVIAAVEETGAVVTIATGRSYRSAANQARILGISSPIVSFQGAHLADPNTGEVHWHQPLTPDLARKTLDAFDSDDFPGDVMAYQGHEIFVKEMTEWINAYSGRNEVTVNAVGDLNSIAEQSPTRFVAVGDPNDIEGLESRLLAKFDSTLHITRSLPQFCEVLHPDAGKHKALAEYCVRLGIRPEQVVVIGNGYNDVHMLEWAGLGVATADAVPQALAVADRVTARVQEDGVAQLLDELLQNGLFS